MGYLAVIIIPYLIGSVNSSIIVCRLWGKIDIRKHGSGNAGMTNTLRTLGVGPAAMVIVGDVLKGIIAVVIGRFLTGNDAGAMIGGLAAVVGHNWPVFFQFKGGKGILTSAAVILMITPKIGLFVLIISILIIALTRYVSLGSLLGALILVLTVIIADFKNTNLFFFSVILTLLALYTHRGNIQRLLNGTERRLGRKE